MSRFYLVPVTSQTINGQSVNAPEYFSTFFAAFTAIPYGLEPLTILSLASDNAGLDAADDVFAFPSDLTQLLTDSDVSNFQNFCQAVNVPSDFAVTGMSWQAVLLQVAQVFLLAQAISGAASGQPIFTEGVTLDSTVGTQNQSAGKGKTGNVQQSTPSALATAAGSIVGPYDLTGVDTSDTVEDTLISISSQFTSPIPIGVGETL
jgi:hypothetical protein